MDAQWSAAAILAELGRRLKRERLNRNITQQELADRGGLSTATIKKIEGGENFSMATLLQILRVLGLVDRIDALVPDPGVSPIELAKLRGKERERASGHRSRSSGE